MDWPASKLKSTLHNYISKSKASYFAPAYNFNSYIDALIKYNINIMNKNYDKNSDYTEHLFTVTIQNTFISMKCLLDRLVTIISFYYPGLSIKSTFGRICDNGNAKNFMKVVLDKKDSDKFMNFIYCEYHLWIKEVVEPRDTIIHYNDMHIMPHYTTDGREFFTHLPIKIFDDSDVLTIPSPDEGHYYKSLMKSVQNLYRFFDIIFEVLKHKDITYKKCHFIKKSDFEIYKNNDYKF